MTQLLGNFNAIEYMFKHVCLTFKDNSLPPQTTNQWAACVTNLEPHQPLVSDP